MSYQGPDRRYYAPTDEAQFKQDVEGVTRRIHTEIITQGKTFEEISPIIELREEGEARDRLMAAVKSRIDQTHEQIGNIPVFPDGHEKPEEVIELEADLPDDGKSGKPEEVIELEADLPDDGISERTKEKILPTEIQEALIGKLKDRFESNPGRHEKIQWPDVEESLRARPDLLWKIQQLEITGGEPDVFLDEDDNFIFGDCSVETPSGRRDVVYDEEALNWLRAQFPNAKCNGSAEEKIKKWDVIMMNEAQYRYLQDQCPVDIDTWSWIFTTPDFREKGLALSGYYFTNKGVAGKTDNQVAILQHDASHHYMFRGFRCVVNVPKLKKMEPVVSEQVENILEIEEADLEELAAETPVSETSPAAETAPAPQAPEEQPVIETPATQELSEPKTEKSLEQAQLLTALKKQYTKMKSVLKRYKIPETGIPVWEKIKCGLTPEILEKVLNLKEPALLLVAPTTRQSKVEAIRKHRIRKQKTDVETYEFDNDNLWNGGKSETNTQWRVVIVDGMKDIPADQEISGTNEEMVRKWNEKYAKDALDIINDANTYLTLMMRGIAEGNPPDQHYLTVLNLKNLTESAPLAYGNYEYENRIVHLCGNFAGSKNDNLFGFRHLVEIAIQ